MIMDRIQRNRYPHHQSVLLMMTQPRRQIWLYLQWASLLHPLLDSLIHLWFWEPSWHCRWRVAGEVSILSFCATHLEGEGFST